MSALVPLSAPNVVPFQRGQQAGNTAPQPGGLTGNQAALQPAQLPLPQTDYIGDRPSVSEQEDGENVDVTELRKQYTDYVTIKQAEILEARTALQYYHADQFTGTEIKILSDRGQKAIAFNRINRKIDGIVGVMQKLRGDPKAFGRNEGNERGAELATQCVRSALDSSQWAPEEAELLRKGACIGIMVAELAIVPGDKKDPDISVAAVDATTFFYDPRSLKLDFSDCRYMGVSKLVTEDEFEEIFPGKWTEAWSTIDDTGQTVFDQDRYFLWSQGRVKLRLIEHWYRSRGEWRYTFYAGTVVLQSGTSPFFDEKGNTVPRYDAVAINIDHVGTHYGFVRNLIGPQDAMNQHRTKSVWIMNTRQLKINRRALGGDGQDIETMRREAARSDGILTYDGDPNDVQVLEATQEFLKQTEYYQDAKGEIDSFGPNPALASGAAPANVSGRSLAMQQQAGIAELGPFPTTWRGWKLRLYRKIWVAQQRNWTAERILRITDDQQIAKYIAINQQKVDPWGRPMLVNAIGQLDVDIIVDESPDVVNVMADTNDLLQSLAHSGTQVPAPVIIQSSALPSSEKTKLITMFQQAQQPTPVQQQAQAAALAESQAKTAKTQADTQASQATAVHKLALAHGEVAKTHATQTGTAIDTMQASQPPLQGQAGAPPAPQGQAPQGGQGQPQPQQPAGTPAGANPQALAALAAALHGGQGAQAGQQPQQPQVPPPGGPPYGGAQLINGQLYIPDPHDPGKWAMVVQP